MTVRIKSIAACALSAVMAFTSVASADTRSYAHEHRNSGQQFSNQQAIGGLLALLAFGAVVHELRQDRDRDRERRADRNTRREQAQNSRRVLPEQCVRRFQTPRGARRLAVQRCLRRSEVRMNRLPNACFREIETNRGLRRGYGIRCLTNRGFSFD